MRQVFKTTVPHQPGWSARAIRMSSTPFKDVFAQLDVCPRRWPLCHQAPGFCDSCLRSGLQQGQRRMHYPLKCGTDRHADLVLVKATGI